jgi:hypothetical protein
VDVGQIGGKNLAYGPKVHTCFAKGCHEKITKSLKFMWGLAQGGNPQGQDSKSHEQDCFDELC